MKELKLEVGCGDIPRPGFEHLDIRKLPGVDIVAPCWAIPRPANHYAEIRARHLLEHCTWAEAMKTLIEFRRVLLPGGFAHIIVPDLAFHCRQFFMDGNSKFIKHSNRKHAMLAFFGWQRNPADHHKWGWDKKSLEEDLIGAGFNLVKFIPTRECDIEVKAFK